MFDQDIPVPTDAELLAWLAAPVPGPLPRDVAHDNFLLMHPRVAFLKALPRGAVVFDIGAGDGNLRLFRDWLAFPRPDLRFVGASLEHGAGTRRYEEFFVGDIEATRPAFRLAPTHAIASQFIEHLRDPGALLGWLHGILPPGGRLFLDWPAPHTTRLPSCRTLADKGYDAFTLNFHDDATHCRALSGDELAALLARAGFRVRGGGLVDLPFLAESLKHHGLATRDKYMLTMALWLRTRFVAWIVAERI